MRIWPPGYLDGTEESLHILLSCYQVLQEVVDPRIPGVLNEAHAQLQARAERIANKRAGRRFPAVEAWAQHARCEG